MQLFQASPCLICLAGVEDPILDWAETSTWNSLCLALQGMTLGSATSDGAAALSYSGVLHHGICWYFGTIFNVVVR